jgi:hypothetical protein
LVEPLLREQRRHHGAELLLAAGEARVRAGHSLGDHLEEDAARGAVPLRVEQVRLADDAAVAEQDASARVAKYERPPRLDRRELEDGAADVGRLRVLDDRVAIGGDEAAVRRVGDRLEVLVVVEPEEGGRQIALADSDTGVAACVAF